jgi:pyridoxal phosphate enzyme (YggS family)
VTAGIAARLGEVRERIARAAARAGRDPAAVRLVAVSKAQPAAAIREAWEAGQRLFGENYVQELLAKQADLGGLEGLAWHFIGHLQRNKVKSVAGRVAMLAVDSERLVAEVSRRAVERSQTVDVVLEVNLGGEATKSGCAPEAAGALLEAARRAPAVRVLGLMVIPPYEVELEAARGYFRSLRELRERLGGAEALPELSMGMSHDFEIAVEEGATLVRVGTAIFGERR